MPLTQRQLELGFDYYVADDWKDYAQVISVDDYRGGSRLIIHCTQLSHLDGKIYASAAVRKRVPVEWCDYLIRNPKQFTELSFVSRVSQEMLDAVCHQVNLTRLDLKWGAYTDLSGIAKLQKLKLLKIGTGARVESLEPLTKLKRLVGLSIENFQKISDYSPLARLRQLEQLSIYGNGPAPTYLRIESLKFLESMTNLRVLKLDTIRLTQKDFSPILKLRKLEHLSLPPIREVKACYEQLVSLPKLKWGSLKTDPERYVK